MKSLLLGLLLAGCAAGCGSSRADLERRQRDEELARHLAALRAANPETRLAAVEWLEAEALRQPPAPPAPAAASPAPGQAAPVPLRVRVVDALIPLLADPEPPVRARAALALGRLGDARALPPLAWRLKREREYEPRRLIIAALAEFDDRRAIPALIGALDDGSAWLRQLAAAGLCRLTGCDFGIDWGDELRLLAGQRTWAEWLRVNRESIPPLPPEPPLAAPSPDPGLPPLPPPGLLAPEGGAAPTASPTPASATAEP